MRIHRFLRTLPGLLLLAVTACTPVVRPTEEPAVEPVAEEEPPTEPVERVYRPIPQDALYALLVAELSARRGAMDVTLANYIEQARRTRDPGVAAQATRIARYLKKPEASLEAALLWADAEPGNPEARYAAASELARAGRIPESFAQMQALYRMGGSANFTALAAGALEGPEVDRRAMRESLDALGDDVGNDVLLARAVLAQSLGDNAAALALTGRILASEPANYQAVLIEAQVYQNRGETAKAFARIEKALAAEPGNSRLRLQYARLLVKSDLDRAAEQYRILLAESPEDPELQLSLALVYREAKRYPEMRELLEGLLASGRQANAARYYLGEDEEREGRQDAALEQYFAIEPSPVFPLAISRIATLLLESGGTEGLSNGLERLQRRWPEHRTRLVLLHAEMLVEREDYDTAWQVLSTALEAEPEETSLLYSRSMVSEKRRDIAGLERDLREMLRIEPDSALALNALGYSLTNLTDRHAEAKELIERALAQKPDDPAILDSMGWVLYRLGQREDALRYLQDAFARFPDPEVAAHLGEVLWVMGRREEALAAWNKGLEKKADSPLVLEAMRRLGAPLPGEGP